MTYYDLIFSRYGAGASNILALPFSFGVKVLRKAKEEKEDERLFQRWIVGGYEKEHSFQDFKKECCSVAVPEKSEVVFEKVKNIIGGVKGWRSSS